MAVYRFKVALDFNKRIYRHIEILDSQTLDDFHWAIYHAFDREDPHLYSFYLTGRATKSLYRRRQALEFTDPMALEDDEFSFFYQKEKYDASQTRIRDLGLWEKDKMYYLFDFGDEWWHEITLLKITDTKETGGYPRVVKIAGASPPQYPEYDEE